MLISKIQNPQIPVKEFVHDLKAFLGHYGRIDHKNSKFLIAVTGKAIFSLLAEAPQKQLRELEERFLTESFENWMNRVVFVDLVCDPVKRLLSDFQHSKAQHPNARKMNRHKFGENSEFSVRRKIL